MKNLIFKTLYGVQQATFNVGENSEVKTHRDPFTGKLYAYASSANVKRNLKELFSELSGIDTPKTEFKKKGSVKNGQIVINAEGKGEQDGVSVFIDQEKPNLLSIIFGVWVSDVSENDQKYVKAALKSCIKVSDMMPVHPLLQYLGKSDVGVFVGDKNSSITIGVDNDGKKATLRTPEQAAELVGCSIDEAKQTFAEQRPLNMYRDKRTASGIYQETFAVEIENFGKIKLSSYPISQKAIDSLLENGWRIVTINGEEYLSPSREVLLSLWKYLVEAMIGWDFSSNNSLHGNVKQPLRYSVSMNANKIDACNTARLETNDNGEQVAKLALRDHKDVQNFNTPMLERYVDCTGMEIDIDADEKVAEALIKLGEEHIL